MVLLHLLHAETKAVQLSLKYGGELNDADMTHAVDGMILVLCRYLAFAADGTSLGESRLQLTSLGFVLVEGDVVPRLELLGHHGILGLGIADSVVEIALVLLQSQSYVSYLSPS